MTSGEYASRSQNAKEYCLSVANEVKALEQLLASGEPFGDDLDDELHELWVELAAKAGADPARYTPSVLDYINLICVECILSGERCRDGDEWYVNGVRLLRSCSGPYADIVWNETDLIVVEVSWVGASSTAKVYAPNLSEAFLELATE